jgi:hypothetical protein
LSRRPACDLAPKEHDAGQCGGRVGDEGAEVRVQRDEYALLADCRCEDDGSGLLVSPTS